MTETPRSTQSEPLTLSQLSVWQDIRDLPPQRRHEPNSVTAWPLPGRPAPERVLRALRAIVGRHPSLRTRYGLADHDAPRQHAPDHDLDEGAYAVLGDAADPEAVARELAGRPFDLGREHSWRARVLTSGRAATDVVFAKHHIAADAWAQEQLRAEILRELAEPGSLDNLTATPAGLAAEQHSEPGRRRGQAALAHWKGVLTAGLPDAALPCPPSAAGTAHQATLRSGPALAAARELARRSGTSLSSAVLAAYARSVARTCGVDALAVRLMSANRFVPRHKTLVTSMNQWVAAVLEKAGGDLELTELARLAHWSSMTACRHGMYDVRQLAALQAALPRPAEPACAFNFVARPGEPTDTEARDHTPELRWEEPFTTLGPRCYARAEDGDGVLTVRLTAKDTDRGQLSDVLWGLHDTLTSATN